MNNSDKKSKAIKVTIYIPEKVSESLKQEKINRLYDILAPKFEETKQEKS